MPAVPNSNTSFCVPSRQHEEVKGESELDFFFLIQERSSCFYMFGQEGAVEAGGSGP